MENSSINKDSLVSVVCNDAGSANLLLSYLKDSEFENFKAYMSGPAEKIWRNLFPKITLCQTIEEAIIGSEVLLSGTGWSTSVEFDARSIANELGIYSIAVIDHWVNYEERFKRRNKKTLPNEIWTYDQYAFDKAKNIFSNTCVKLKKNNFITHLLRQSQKVTSPKIPELLYLSEPIRDNWGKNIEGEFQALKYFIDKIDSLGLDSEFRFKLRLHPSEPRNKYVSFLDQMLFDYEMDEEDDLGISLSRATWVAGVQTYGLTLGLELNKIVFSSIPPWAPPSVLPHQKISYLKKI